MTGILEIIVRSRVAQAICCITPNSTIWANRLCAGMDVCEKQMYASLLISFITNNVCEEEGILKSNFTEEQFYTIFDKIADLLCIRWNLCIQDETTILNTLTGDVIQWVDLLPIDDTTGEAYQWNN